MKSMIRRFYMFGVIVTITVFIGLFFQYNYFNKRLTEEMESSIVLARDVVSADINNKLMIDRQIIADAADYISVENHEEEELLRYFKKLMNKYPAFYSIYFGTVDNIMINGSGWIPPEEFDLRTRPWYIKAVQENELVFSEAFVNASKDMLVITIAQPVYNSNNQLLGVVAGDISIKDIISIIIQDKKIMGMGYSFLIDGKGNILAHPNYQYDFNSELKNISEISGELNQYIEQRRAGIISIILDGANGYLAYKPIDNTDWIIGSFIPQAEYMQTNKRLMRMFLIVLLASMGGFILLLMFQKRQFIIPIRQLEEDIEKISIEKKIDYRLSIQEKDPFAILRKSINAVLDKTQEFFIQLLVEEEELAASMEQLTATEEELRNHYDKLVESQRLLEKSELQNSSIIKAIPDLLFILNHEGQFVDCLNKDEKPLLMPKKEFLGKTLWEVMPKKIADQAYENIQRTLAQGTLFSFEYELQILEKLYCFELRIVKNDEKRVLAISRDITERKHMERRLEYLSYRDQLTGLYNRRFFEEELDRQDTIENLPLSVIIADVNGLKLINDSFGHGMGDKLLRKVAEVIQKGCKTSDIISRIGGDEFVILLPKTDSFETESIVKRIKNLVQCERIGSIEISISFGYETRNSKEQKIQEVIKKAEDNMYKIKLFEGPSMRGRTVKTIINTLHEKNKREEQHSHRVASLATDLGRALKLSEAEIQELKTIGLLHDIGKIAIDESILNKPGKLNEEEWQEMKHHSEIGFRILSTTSDMAELGEYVLYHHERWDGKGYPSGLKHEEIPLQSRIICIVDAYDAMTSERTYSNPLSEEIAIEELQKNAGSQFDPKITRIFIEKVLGK